MTVKLFFFNVKIIFYDEKLLKKKKKKNKEWITCVAEYMDNNPEVLPVADGKAVGKQQ